VPVIGYMSMSGFDAEDGGKQVPCWSLDGLLSYAEWLSQVADVEREGLVWKKLDDPSVSFKVISNKWLLKEKE